MKEVDKSILLLAATIGAIGLLILLMFFPIPSSNAQIFLALAGFVFGYFFGSSNTKTGLSTGPTTTIKTKEITNESTTDTVPPVVPGL